jgi:hypothetical protein
MRAPSLPYERRRALELSYAALLERLTLPLVASRLAHPTVPVAHRPSRGAARALVRRVRRIVASVPSASSAPEHLAMIQRLLLVEPAVPGVVVECGCWKGASTSSLSVAAEIVDRPLRVFDSFAGLPPVADVDREHVLVDRPEVHTYEAGMFAGRLDEVRANVAAHGEIGRCTFHEGWFSDTLPGFDEPVVLAFVDVDLRTALEECVEHLWPRLQPGCALFVHEAPHHEIASLFYDEEWWRERLGEPAPGLAGAGSGIGLEFTDGFWRSAIGFAVRRPDVASYYRRPPVDVVGTP